MLSLIICSRNNILSEQLTNNIQSTIGEEYEIVHINNQDNKYTIFEAYQKGVETAKGQTLIFMHEDIIFRTKDWGKIVSETLQREKVAISGNIGGHIINETSLSWTSSGYYSGQVYQIDGAESIFYDHSVQKLGDEVVAIDGMFFAIHKKLFDDGTLRWDCKTYNGFHFYDLDICMQAQKAGYKVIVTPIILEHHSKGSFNESFYESCVQFHKKWDNYLPIVSPSISSKDLKVAYQKSLEKTCALGSRYAQQTSILQKLPYKITSKILLLLGRDPYKR